MTIMTTAALAVAPPPAQDDTRDAAARLADQLVECRAIEAAETRLDCYDRAVTAIDSARRSGDLVVLDRDGIRRAKRTIFGFSLPRLGLFGGGNDAPEEPEVRSIDSTVSRVAQSSAGRYDLYLADGSVWQTTEARSGFFPRDGRPIVIEAAILGSYVAKIDGGRGIKVKRLR